MEEDKSDTHCVICGDRRMAYSHPPVCVNCLDQWRVETAYNRFAQEQADAEEDVQQEAAAG